MRGWSRLPIFWKFQIPGWIIFVALTFPLKLVIFGGLNAAIIICIVRDGSSFLLTLALWQIYRIYWKEQIGRMAALILVACAVAGLLQAGLFLLLSPLVSNEAELNIARPKQFNVLYERAGILYAWSFLYFGIRHAVDGTRRELRLPVHCDDRNGDPGKLFNHE